jgi:betaine reductase
MPQSEFYGFMKIVDEFDLVAIESGFLSDLEAKLQAHPLITAEDITRLGSGIDSSALEAEIESGALPLYESGAIVGCLRQGHEEDENLFAPILLENLSAKASGILALRYALRELEGGGQEIDYVMSCGEEGVGDRYQRGAGNLAKAMAEFAGCVNSSGTDIKAFCCSPVHTLVIAAGLVQSGIFKNIAVVGGGSLAKLGMKMRGHLAKQTPIMEDVLGALAVIVSADDGRNPCIRIDSIGKHDVSAGSSPQAIMTALVTTPLDRIGLKIKDVDKFATEMHNPEITEPAGSGNVPNTNYRMIGGLAVMRKELQASELNGFVRQYGMPGFSPTQGHIAAAVAFLGHAREMILESEIKRAMFVAKGSLFLGKMTKLSDGMSFILERNGETNGY